jgi:hypothetical protein
MHFVTRWCAFSCGLQVLEQDGDKYYEMRLVVGLLLLVYVIV